MLSHRNLSFNVLQALPYFQISEEDVFLHAAPMFHIADGFCCMMTATMGCTNVIVPAFDPVQVLETIQDEKVSAALLVPTMINVMVNFPGAATPTTCRNCRELIYGASPMPEAVIMKAWK